MSNTVMSWAVVLLIQDPILRNRDKTPDETTGPPLLAEGFGAKRELGANSIDTRPTLMQLRNILFLVFVSAASLFAVSGSRPVAWPGQPVTANDGWPTGAMALINDPARTEGWNPWFSGFPNDVNYYAFKLSNSADANRLIQRLAAIQTNVYLKLNPAREATSLAFITRLKEGSGYAAVFALGNQRVLNEQFAQRAKVPARPGPASTPAATPAVALPPTLTLYVGHPSIDLATLEIPAYVNVSADIPDATRKQDAANPVFRAIDALVAQHQAKQRPPGAVSK